MELIQLTETAYQLRGGSNAGLLAQDGQAVLIDAGLDKDTARKILRHVDALKVTLTAIVITHAHADHFGGAATIRRELTARGAGPRVYAPALEAAIVENPILEPLYLFSGALPPAELRHKFTLGDACPVDELLQAGNRTVGGLPVEIFAAPGHAPNQMIAAGGGACFVADAVFAPDVLAKHGIPFMVDLDAWMTTLADVAALGGRYAAYSPGHGPAVPTIGEWALENADRLRALRLLVAEAAAATDDVDATVKACADRLGLSLANLTSYLLARTAVLACIASLHAAGDARLAIEGNGLRLRLKPPRL